MDDETVLSIKLRNAFNNLLKQSSWLQVWGVALYTAGTSMALAVLDLLYTCESGHPSNPPITDINVRKS